MSDPRAIARGTRAMIDKMRESDPGLRPFVDMDGDAQARAMAAFQCGERRHFTDGRQCWCGATEDGNGVVLHSRIQ